MGLFRREPRADILALVRETGVDIPVGDTVIAACAVMLTTADGNQPDLDRKLQDAPGELVLSQHRVVLLHQALVVAWDITTVDTHPINVGVAIIDPGDGPTFTVTVAGRTARDASEFHKLIDTIESARQMSQRMAEAMDQVRVRRAGNTDRL